MCLAIPGKIVSITGEDQLSLNARVDFGGVIRDVSLACVPDAEAGQYVTVHVGVALSIVDEAEAASLLELIAQLDPDEAPA